jgi:hypothetical protein
MGLFFIESIGLENPTGSIPFRWPILTPSSDTRKALENKDRVSVAKGCVIETLAYAS